MCIVIFKSKFHYKSINHLYPTRSTILKLGFKIPILRNCLQSMDEAMHPFFSQNFSLGCHIEMHVVSRIILEIILVYEIYFYLTKSYPH